MTDFGEPNSSTSSGASQIATAAEKAYQTCKRGLAGVEFVKVDGELLRVEVTKALDLVAGPLVECGPDE